MQFLTFTQREFLLQIRLVKTLLIDVFLVFFAGGVLGALYIEVGVSIVVGMYLEYLTPPPYPHK